MSIRQLAARHHTHRRTVRRALASPTPPPRKTADPRPSPRIDPIRDTIDAIRRERDLTIWQIWSRLVDDHGAEVSYSTVAGYIRRADST